LRYIRDIVTVFNLQCVIGLCISCLNKKPSRCGIPAVFCFSS